VRVLVKPPMIVRLANPVSMEQVHADCVTIYGRFVNDISRGNGGTDDEDPAGSVFGIDGRRLR
jgi:hypothetical protein